MRNNEIALLVQVAQDAGVSYSDVLRVFYGESIDPSRQSRIISTASALRCWDHPSPRSARPSIGLIAAGPLTGDYSGKLLQGIHAAADALGYDLAAHIQHIALPDQLDMHCRTLFELGYADQGFLMLTHDHCDIPASYCQRHHRPYVLGDCDANEDISTRQPSIGIDNRQAVIDIMRYLIELGHRRIGIITGHPSVPSAYWRLQGYLSGLAEAGLAVDESLVVEGNYWWTTGEELAPVLMQQTPSPTAIVASNDLMALGAMASLVRLGWRVPLDLSLTGFDDIEMAESVSPRLTTVRQPLVEMGQAAVEMLDQMIQYGTLDDPYRIFPTELVIRESVQPPRRRN